ncbi:hypothetical protein IVB03_39705 [Bradyrhizobium sp. 168]|jgi:hypothetical protein|uniref:hypothetical protein n=1 Tax=Bradyrhizobium sp. 168 TaxID=2782639 RepID=UPI001FF99177|nr:hypothetical protein [Bradyrhizobium sp. 168]MCK1585523.1 hypothetical protein [Bradyrhizobium sp. 168]
MKTASQYLRLSAEYERAAAQAADQFSRHQFLVLADSYLTLARSAEFLSQPHGLRTGQHQQEH